MNSPKIILFQPEIAQNLGTIIRLCACFGVPLDIIEPCGFPFSSKALRRSMMDYGKLESITRHNSFQEYKKCNNSVVQPSRMILFTTKGTECLWKFNFFDRDHLIFGNEGHGVPEEVAQEAAAKVFIPMPGKGRSLNLAISVGIALSEALRQLTNLEK